MLHLVAHVYFARTCGFGTAAAACHSGDFANAFGSCRYVAIVAVCMLGLETFTDTIRDVCGSLDRPAYWETVSNER